MSTRLVTDCLFCPDRLNGKTVEFFLAENDIFPFSQGANAPCAQGVGELIAHEEGTGFYLDVLVQVSDFENNTAEQHVSHNVHIMLTEQAASRIEKHPEPNVADFLIPEQMGLKHSNQPTL